MRLFSAKILILITLIFAATLSARADEAFENWLSDLRADALDAGISAETVSLALSNVQLREKVVKYDRNQPEFKLTYDRYMRNVVPASRVEEGKRKWAENEALLKEIGDHFNVQPRYIVALWGIESSFGRHTGGFSVINALASLSYDGRRAKFFRKELLSALRIIDEGHISYPSMKGSWAGAMGQCQFMPSSFLAYAYDWDKDGKQDIWGNQADIFASIANYLKNAGWRDDLTWGREVKLPSHMASKAVSMADDKIRKSMDEWRKMGITNPDGSPLPKRNLTSRLVLPDGLEGPAFIVYANFDATLRWNRSNYFALAVGALSDAMAYSR